MVIVRVVVERPDVWDNQGEKSIAGFRTASGEESQKTTSVDW